MIKYIFLAIFAFMVTPSVADDSAYNTVRDTVFWGELYDKDYKTFYCGIEKTKGSRVTVEHVYPASWIATSFGCKSRRECKLDKYRAASSDLHNLWPALKRFNSSRGNLAFGEILGEISRFETPVCDFERTTGKNAIVEPRDEIKGKIARSFLYMVHWYDLPTHDLLPLMVMWNEKYPPTPQEIQRQKWIEANQGRRNPFVEVD